MLKFSPLPYRKEARAECGAQRRAQHSTKHTQALYFLFTGKCPVFTINLEVRTTEFTISLNYSF